MEKPKNNVLIQFKSVPENISLARVLVASIGAQFDLTINDLDELKVAVSEAVSNAMIHGYLNDPDKEVEMEITCYEEKLIIRVTDYGVGIADVQLALQPSYSTEDDHMGLGFVFIQSFMDKIDVKSELNQGTTVTMVKNLVHRQES
ncbi:MAG: anti-sigma F factor [Dehalobacterium sp.]